MRIFHLADLHIGKIVNGFSMIDEQQYILNQIIDKVKDKKPDVIMIAGDVYDKRNPSNEAVSLFSDFITKLSALSLDILIVSGNHDSGDKLQFLNEILNKQKIHIVGDFKEAIYKLRLSDEYGLVNFYLMPFVRPSDVRSFYPEVDSYHTALEVAISKTDIDYSQRNIFIGHQFFAGAMLDLERSESELISVGGIDNVGYNLLLDFDYAALGHLHKAQKLGVDYIRYSGSPLKYSESEVNHNKSIVMIDLKEKDNLEIQKLSLSPKTQMRQVRDYIELILDSDYDKDSLDDFVHVILLDDDEVIDAIGKLRNKYQNIMSLKFENVRSQIDNQINVRDDISETNPIQLFHDFFKLQNNQEMNKNQSEMVEKLIGKEEI